MSALTLSREDIVRLCERIEGAQTRAYAIPKLTDEYPAMTIAALAERAIRSLRQRYPGPHRLTVLACNFEGVPIVTVEEHELT